MTSILHRITGVALSIGLFLVTWGLIALASGREAYEFFISFCLSPLGQIGLAGMTLAFYYHLCSGIRHLIRDFGYLYENKDSLISGWFILVSSVLMTLGTWAYIYSEWIGGVIV